MWYYYCITSIIILQSQNAANRSFFLPLGMQKLIKQSRDQACKTDLSFRICIFILLSDIKTTASLVRMRSYFFAEIAIVPENRGFQGHGADNLVVADFAHWKRSGVTASVSLHCSSSPHRAGRVGVPGNVKSAPTTHTKKGFHQESLFVWS